MSYRSHSYIIMLLCSLLFFVGCEEDITIEEIDFEPTLVVNSIFSNDTVLCLKITESRNLLDANSQIRPVSDAIVYIKDDFGNLLVTMEHDENGVYKTGEYKPTSGQSYNLEVFRKGYEVITAHTSIPTKAKVDIHDVDIVMLDDKPVLKVDFEIQDNETESNYYVWEIVTEETRRQEFDINTPSNTYNNWLTFNPETNNVFNKNGQSKLFLTDASFEGVSYSTSFVSSQNLDQLVENPNSPPDSEEPIVIKPKVELRVMTVSKDMYEYYQSVERYLQKKHVSSSITEPEPVFSNIVNGYGIFGGYTEEYIQL